MTAASHNGDSAETLDASRHALIRQLHEHPEDFAATIELQAVNAASNRIREETIDTTARDSLQRAGMSSFERTRLRFHRRFGRNH
jgi:hypothetical protein